MTQIRKKVVILYVALLVVVDVVWKVTTGVKPDVLEIAVPVVDVEIIEVVEVEIVVVIDGSPDINRGSKDDTNTNNYHLHCKSKHTYKVYRVLSTWCRHCPKIISIINSPHYYCW